MACSNQSCAIVQAFRDRVSALHERAGMLSDSLEDLTAEETRALAQAEAKLYSAWEALAVFS